MRWRSVGYFLAWLATMKEENAGSDNDWSWDEEG